MKARPHLLAALAGLAWAAIGFFLAARAIASFQTARAEGLAGNGALAGLAVLGLALGLGKGLTVLRKSARKNVVRLKRAAAAAPAGRVSLAATFTPAMWGVIAGMSLLGMALRYAGLSPLVRGPVLLAVGLGLLLGSIFYFAGAAAMEKGRPSPDGGDLAPEETHA